MTPRGHNICRWIIGAALVAAASCCAADAPELPAPRVAVFDFTEPAERPGRLIGRRAADAVFAALGEAARWRTVDRAAVLLACADEGLAPPFAVGHLQMLGERLGRIQNRRCTTGDGAAKAEGITVASTEGKEAASATALDADEIIELIHSVDPSYRSQGSRFMMHDSVFLQVTLLKDGEGNYLHQPGLADGSDLRVRGYPVTINQHMASSVAASAKVMLFGLLSKYLIREVSTMRLRRLVERFAEYDQTAFLALLSFDGGLLDAGTHPVKHMVMAAA